ncbi:MAG: hypothetical protein E7510_05225 [Ruminococcus sp.]|nr:hypothetical protein [Ruminococcus sp.]
MSVEVFNDLTYDDDMGSFGSVSLEFCGNTVVVPLLVVTEDDGKTDSKQEEAFKKFLEKSHAIFEDTVAELFEYYKEIRAERGFDKKKNKFFPEVLDINEFKTMIELSGVFVPESDAFDERAVFLTFECSWDTENGVEVHIFDEQVAEMGEQQIEI